MGQRQRQRVGRIRRGQFGQVQHALHHFGHRELLRGAVADDGLLHLARRQFINLQAGFGDGGQRRAAGFAHDEGGLQVLRVEQSLDHAHGGLMLREHFAQGLRNFDQATGVFPAGRAGNRAVGEGLRMRFGQANDAVAGAAQRGVHAEN